MCLIVQHLYWNMIVFFVLLVIFLFIINKLWCFRCRSKVNLHGKTAIVTGGASGIGFQTVLNLASRGCKVIIADVELSSSVAEARNQTKNHQIFGKKLDLGSFDSVRKFAKDIMDNEPRLDILVCNAGIGNVLHRVITDDGLEQTMQVNYFSHFLLTHLLLDLLKKSAPSRITFTSSIVAYWSCLTIDTLLKPSEKYYLQIVEKFNSSVYGNSKLCLAAAARMFGHKLKGTGVTANAVHPAGVKTPIFWKCFTNDNNWMILPIMAFVQLTGKNSDDGAQTLIHLATSQELEGVTGKSFYEGRVVRRPFQLTNDFCQQLWDKSIELTKLKKSEIRC